jgi:hypothetical protein
MTVVVTFVKTQGIEGAYAAPGVGVIRVREDVTVPGTTTNSVQDGEVVIVGNAESNMVAVAFGNEPDAATTGYPVAAGSVKRPTLSIAWSEDQCQGRVVRAA